MSHSHDGNGSAQGNVGISEKPALQLVRHYPVAPAKVWKAWTDPQALSVWFGPGHPNSVTQALLDVRVGGRFDIVFQTPDGEEHGVGGRYVEVKPAKRLVFTWAWRSTPERESLVSIDFDAVDGGTRMSFLHEQFFDQAARDGHQRGWTATLEKLAATLQSA